MLDFLSVGRRGDARAFDYVTLAAPGSMVRRLRALSGAPKVSMRFRPAGPN